MPSHVALAGGTSSSSSAEVPALGASGGSHQAGIAPDPGATAGTKKVLKENATWGLLPDFVAAGASHAAGQVPDPGATIGSARFLCEDAQWREPWEDFGPSGDDRSSGLVPQPPDIAGAVLYLREDATWHTPPAGASTGYVDAADAAIVTASLAAFASKSNNLSDLTSVPTALSVLGLTALLANAPVLLDTHPLAAANTYSTPTWAANAYHKIIIEFIGKVDTGASPGTLLGLIVNADTATHYSHLGWSNPAFLASESSAFAVLAYAKIGAWNLGASAAGALKALVEFFPKTNGYVRMGNARSHSPNAPGPAGAQLQVDLAWNDTATDVTSLTIKTVTATDTLTGIVKVWGVP